MENIIIAKENYCLHGWVPYVEQGEIGISINKFEYTSAQEVLFMTSGLTEILCDIRILPSRFSIFDSIEEAIRASQKLNPKILTKEKIARFFTNPNAKVRELTKMINLMIV